MKKSCNRVIEMPTKPNDKLVSLPSLRTSTTPIRDFELRFSARYNEILGVNPDTVFRVHDYPVKTPDGHQFVLVRGTGEAQDRKLIVPYENVAVDVKGSRIWLLDREGVSTQMHAPEDVSALAEKLPDRTAIRPYREPMPGPGLRGLGGWRSLPDARA